MKRWQKNALITCLSLFALLVIAVIIIIVHSVNGSKNDQETRKRAQDEQNSKTPTNSAPIDPIVNEITDQNNFSGTLTVSECFEKSKDDPIVFYLLDGRPKKDAYVDAIIIFYQEKATIFDENTVKGCFNEDRTIGSILAISQSELVKKLNREYSKQLDAVMNTFIDTRCGVLCGLYLKGKAEAEPWFSVSGFFSKETPEKWDYYISLITDDSGNNVETELMYIPRPVRCGSMAIKSHFGIEEMQCGQEGNLKYADSVVLGTVCHVNMKDKNELREWEDFCESETSFLLSNDAVIRESLWTVDLTGSVSGQIFDHDYFGFTVDGENSIITLCEPGTKISPDAPTAAKKSSLVLVDPQPEDLLAVKYRISDSLDRSVESILERKNAESFFEQYLNIDSARELVGSEYEYERKLGYALLEYLGAENELQEAKHNRAKEYLALGDYEEAYQILEEIGLEQEIIESKYARANESYRAGDYSTAYRLYEESGHNDDALQCEYEIAKILLSDGDYDQAYCTIS